MFNVASSRLTKVLSASSKSAGRFEWLSHRNLFIYVKRQSSLKIANEKAHTKKTNVEQIKLLESHIRPRQAKCIEGYDLRINSKKRYSGHFHREKCLKIQMSSQIILSIKDHKQRKS